jgi:hypothetical protein
MTETIQYGAASVEPLSEGGHKAVFKTQFDAREFYCWLKYRNYSPSVVGIAVYF